MCSTNFEFKLLKLKTTAYNLPRKKLYKKLKGLKRNKMRENQKLLHLITLFFIMHSCRYIADLRSRPFDDE
ncbi:hypothetical protein ID47_05205 [Candidatus Paracaedibacter acanthamoebae]|uniref:Uncharacterized protein n=1 Tax=Candidatus Odyssella acanthamoebae TaxID=91604 RepID=A0A077AST4_9PROT|nr:hypothetical protein ID47_05205 [Candidatus Paracaedibacter acanthamoebae]